MEPFVQGLLAGYGIAIPVGAVAVLIVNASVQCGFRIGFFAGAGAATADFLYASVAALAGVALQRMMRPITEPLQVASGIVLILLAASIFQRSLKGIGGEDSSAVVCGPWRLYLQFLGITIINPLTVVYFTALILGSESGAATSGPTLVPFVLGVGIASLSWQTLLAYLGALVRDRLPSGFRQLTTLLGGLLVAILGLRVLILTMS